MSVHQSIAFSATALSWLGSFSATRVSYLAVTWPGAENYAALGLGIFGLPVLLIQLILAWAAFRYTREISAVRTPIRRLAWLAPTLTFVAICPGLTLVYLQKHHG